MSKKINDNKAAALTPAHGAASKCKWRAWGAILAAETIEWEGRTAWIRFMECYGDLPEAVEIMTPYLEKDGVPPDVAAAFCAGVIDGLYYHLSPSSYDVEKYAMERRESEADFEQRGNLRTTALVQFESLLADSEAAWGKSEWKKVYGASEKNEAEREAGETET